MYHRRIIVAVAANTVVNLVSSFTSTNLPPWIWLIIGSMAIAAMVFAMTAIYSLASILINKGVGVLCAVLMIVPCLSVFVLLVVYQKATSYLQQYGVRVGFLGVNPRSI